MDRPRKGKVHRDGAWCGGTGHRGPNLEHDLEHPPKNRLASPRQVLDIEVEHAGGVVQFNPNSQIMALVERPDAMAAWRPVDGAVSAISGEPAIIVRTHDLEIPLTVDEYAGLVGSELRPDEFKALLDRYGSFFEIHDDFYDAETGEAWQPKGLRERFRVAEAAVRSGLEPTAAPGIFLTPKA